MPILGGFGNASEYAYRSFIVEIPDPFDWVDLDDVEPGTEYISGYAKISGIKSPLPVRISIGSSFSIISNVFDNEQTVSFDNDRKDEASFDEYSQPNSRFQESIGIDATNAFIKNNQSINLSIFPEKLVKEDFNKTYTVNVSVGRSNQDWIVKTRPIDDTPDAFVFTAIGSTTTNTTTQTNEIIISGLEPGFPFDYSVSAGIGSVIVNGFNRGSSYSIFNGDSIRLETTSSSLFNTTTFIAYQVGSYSTSWSVSTEIENLNITFTPTDFTDQTNLQLSTAYDSNQITISGLSLNSELPVTLSNTNASYEVDRGGSIVKSFTANSIGVVNNDKIRLRLSSSSSYSTAVSTNLTIGNTSADWRITTRDAPPPPIDPPRIDPPPTTFAPVRAIYRYYNPSIARHACSQNPSHPLLVGGGGFYNEGVLCFAFYAQNFPVPPGTFGPITFTSYGGYSFPCGKHYLSPNSNSVGLYELRDGRGNVLWSPRTDEGVQFGYRFVRTVAWSPISSINF